MRNSTTSRRGSSQRGMALIMVLLFLILTSALAFALLYKVNSEQKMQKSDSGNTAAFYAAEAGMEKINADLNLLYTLQAAPDWCDIQTVAAASNEPNETYVGATYPEYAITVPDPQPVGCAPPLSHAQTITQGPNAGLQALVVPLTVRVTAQKPSGEQVAMIRNIEVAQIPVFQFGMFSETDLSFFPGGTTDLNGRVQTNHNLYLTPGGTLTLHSQVRAAGDVVRDRMPNGRLTTDSPTHTAPVYIPTQPTGCDGLRPACRALALTSLTGPEGSSSGGPTPPNCDPAVADEVGGAALCSGTAIGGWQTVSNTDYGGMILSGSTGAKALHLAFVQGNVGPVEIIRRPEPTDSPALTASRLYNLAQIRVLLSDDPSELPATTGFQASGSTLCANPCQDPENIRLSNGQYGGAPDYTNGVPFEGSSTNTMMFAEGTTSPTATSEMDWVLPGNILSLAPYAQTMVPNTAPILPSGTTWNLLDGYLRVEIRQTDGSYKAVTHEWLQYGFARSSNPMTTAGNEPPNVSAGTNPDGDAILVLQHLADRNDNNLPDAAGGALTNGYSACYSSDPYPPPSAWSCTVTSSVSTGCSGGKKKSWTYNCPNRPAELASGTAGSKIYGPATRNNWYPINFYDPREGEWRGNDNFPTCSVNGVMNATDIDVGNLRKWLLGTGVYASGSGPLTESDTQNGYVLYFSDRRGMLANATTTSSANGSSSGIKDGEYGFEDVINTASSSYLPNNSLDDGENVNASHDSSGTPTLDTWGKLDLGYGFGASAYQNPAARIGCLTTARKNWVSGARHVVRLVDGWRGQVPTKSDGTGGFTLASENPAYVVGDYNALTSEGGSAQTASGTYTQPHANSAVISDSLVLLSNAFTDIETWRYPTTEASRTGADTYYRMAIATGKNMNYPYNSTNAATDGDFGTDGGTHNFLHYIESQGGHTVSYLGSMVSLYYSMYNTGVHKTGGAIYSVPTRDYGFDPDFLDITKMPPGTPRFRDVVNLGFQQVF